MKFMPRLWNFLTGKAGKPRRKNSTQTKIKDLCLTTPYSEKEIQHQEK
jgi:hypothetical protein